MHYLELNLRDHFPALYGDDVSPRLRCYLRDNPEGSSGLSRLPAVIVFPGGGYSHLSPREGEPVALSFLSAGCNAFVLYYSVKPAKYPSALLQALASVALVRRNAEQWGIDPSNVNVCGFSAGGHLAALTATRWKESALTSVIGADATECRPDGMILGYSVISASQGGHLGSFINLLGEGTSETEADALSANRLVDGDTPRAFLWHTANDRAVPVRNALLMSSALSENGVSFELHVFPDGPHGSALCTVMTAPDGDARMILPHAAGWIDLCREWIFEK